MGLGAVAVVVAVEDRDIDVPAVPEAPPFIVVELGGDIGIFGVVRYVDRLGALPFELEVNIIDSSGVSDTHGDLELLPGAYFAEIGIRVETNNRDLDLGSVTEFEDFRWGRFYLRKLALEFVSVKDTVPIGVVFVRI